MRYPEQVISRALSAAPDVARHIGFRIFPMIVPVSSDLPFVTYQRTRVSREQTLTTPAGVPKTVIELNIFSESYAQVREIADSMRKVIDHYSGTVQGVTVAHVKIEDESEDMMQLEGGDLPPAWQVSLDLEIQWQE